QRLEGPADLVIEIASEGDPGFDVREKLPRYREARIPEIWLVDPIGARVRVVTLVDGEYRERTVMTGRIESTLLPGFWIEADWLWQDPLPSTTKSLQAVLDS
ncbi:MAG: Uma2 family endonuclease, partial [Thermoanaerobaculia bacterium]